MRTSPYLNLSRRERQIMEVLERHGEATVRELADELGAAVSYDAVRGTLRILREKGTVVHRHDGKRYVFAPATSRIESREGALQHLVSTFFDASPAKAMAALLAMEDTTLSTEDIEQLTAIVRRIPEASRRLS